MSDNYRSIPLLIGVSILFLIPIGVGGFVYTSLRDDNAENTGKNNSQSEDSPFKGLAKETNAPRTMSSPAPEDGGGTGIDSDSDRGIPIGKYSNPPTRIESTGSELLNPIRPIDNFDSDVERNKLNQRSIDNAFPDYSSDSASNNFNRPDDNSLVTPLEDDSFLEVPESDDEEMPALSPISPVGDSLTQP